MFRHTFVGVVLLVVTGCAQPYVIREHSGAERPMGELTRVKGQNHTLFLASVDGRKKNYAPLFRGPLFYSGFDLLLDPGEHTIGIYYEAGYAEGSSSITKYTKPRDLKFNGLPGSVYEVCSVHGRNSLRIDIRQIE
jgi:hypothetical protein